MNEFIKSLLSYENTFAIINKILQKNWFVPILM